MIPRQYVLRRRMMLNNINLPVLITGSNIAKYFDVINGYDNGREIIDEEYWFEWSEDTQSFVNTNVNIDDSSATTTLIARQTFDFSFDYSYVTESGADKFSASITNCGAEISEGRIEPSFCDSQVTIANCVSGSGSGTYTGTIVRGQRLHLTYYKDASVSTDEDTVSVSNFTVLKRKASYVKNYNDIEQWVTVITGKYDGYLFEPDGSGAFVTNNYDIHDSGAMVSFTAKQNVKIYFSWECSSEEDCDELSIGNDIFVSGVMSGGFSISLQTGNTLSIEYWKDDGVSENEDRCKIFDLCVELE